MIGCLRVISSQHAGTAELPFELGAALSLPSLEAPLPI